ncbi:MAG: MbnP family protein [Bacteroidia bacterium]
MKLFSIALVCALAFVFGGCKDEEIKPIDTPKKTGTLTLQFANAMEGTPLTKNSSSYYSNAAGNEFIVSTFQYYISNIELTKIDGSKVKFGHYELIDAFDLASQTVTLDDVPNGDYKAISYFIGIDSLRNHSGNQDGDLSPTKGMLWTWSSGYLFLKLEGFYKDGISQNSFRYHIGTDQFLNKISNSISFKINADTKKAFMNCNLAEFFKNPNVFDIKADDDIQSFPSEKVEAGKLAANMVDLITVLKVE